MASYNLPVPLKSDPESYWNSVSQNCDNLEQVVANFAEQEAIEFLSLSTHFHHAASAGALSFLSADTH